MTSKLSESEVRFVKAQNRLVSLKETLKKSQNDILKLNSEKNMVIAERNKLAVEVQKKQTLINKSDLTIRRQNNELMTNARNLRD